MATPVERLLKFASDIDYDQQEIGQLCDLALSTVSALVVREKKGIGSLMPDSIAKIALRFHLSLDWINGGEGPKYRPELLVAQRALHNWAYTSGLEQATPRERLVAVWQKWQELLPTFEERIWAAYLRLADCLRTKQPNSKPIRVSVDKWAEIRNGRNPDDGTLLRASLLTFLPLSWYAEGKQPAMELSKLENYMIATFLSEHDLSVGDVIRILSQKGDLTP